jgi:hypothetical protein
VAELGSLLIDQIGPIPYRAAERLNDGFYQALDKGLYAEFGQAGQKGEALGNFTSASLLRQRKPYLTGSPPSRQERRCRQECRVVRV